MTTEWATAFPALAMCHRNRCTARAEGAWATERGWVAACSEHKAEAFRLFHLPETPPLWEYCEATLNRGVLECKLCSWVSDASWTDLDPSTFVAGRPAAITTHLTTVHGRPSDSTLWDYFVMPTPSTFGKPVLICLRCDWRQDATWQDLDATNWRTDLPAAVLEHLHDRHAELGILAW